MSHAIASNPNTPPTILAALAADANCDVRCAVAGNPNTPLASLAALAADADWLVRHRVARNPSPPTANLEALAADADEDVRYVVGGNPSTPPTTLVALAADADRNVRWAVAGNPNTPPALNVPDGESVVTKAKWIMEARAMGHKLQGEREDEIDRLRKRVAELEAAEVEPPQVFCPPISVTVRHACDHPFAEVVIGAIQDPAFLAIPMGARLGLVVLRG